MLSRSLLERRVASRAQVADSLRSDGQGWRGRLGTGFAGCANRFERGTAASIVFAAVFGVGECGE